MIKLFKIEAKKNGKVSFDNTCLVYRERSNTGWTRLSVEDKYFCATECRCKPKTKNKTSVLFNEVKIKGKRRGFSYRPKFNHR